MANTMRWRYGDTNPVMLAVDSDTEIEIGDLVFLDTDDAKPASSQFDQGTLLANQQTFHDSFIGVAMQCSGAGETALIRVATTGVFEFACSAATFEVGTPIGVSEAASGTELQDQQVEAVTAVDAAIGRAASRADAATSRVLVDIVSSVMKGGVQAVA